LEHTKKRRNIEHRTSNAELRTGSTQTHAQFEVQGSGFPHSAPGIHSHHTRTPRYHSFALTALRIASGSGNSPVSSLE
jgi:hypothetical protein